MMTALRKFIGKEGLTPSDAAKRLKVSEPRISDLTRGLIFGSRRHRGEWLSAVDSWTHIGNISGRLAKVPVVIKAKSTARKM